MFKINYKTFILAPAALLCIVAPFIYKAGFDNTQYFEQTAFILPIIGGIVALLLSVPVFTSRFSSLAMFLTSFTTLLAFVKENRGFDEEFGIFEIGHTVNGLRADGTCNEENRLGAAIYSKVRSEEDVFTSLADVARELCSDILHKNAEFESVDAEFDFEHPVNTFGVFADGVRIGTLSVPHPTVLSNIDKKCAVAFLEIGTEKFASVAAGKNSYAQPSKFPAIDIDLTFVADVSTVDFALVTEKAKEVAGASLADVKAKDIYTGEDGSTALTLRFSFVSYDKTLSKQELMPAIDAIVLMMNEMGMPMKA